ncbi:MAG TPA: peptidyl-prolyl cis-trans isomerase [Bdellovibrionales bacterium]|nr:peptidyl-prolyl cis-trans isomerase [Bdellovibrionales bacterium]
MRVWLLCFLLLPGCDWLSTPSLSRKVIMDVNGRQQTAQDFARELAYRLRDQDALSAKDPKLVATMKAKIVEDFLVQTLTEAWARENGVVLKAEELEAQIQAVQKSYADDLAFQQALTTEGVSFKDWRERLQSSLLQKEVARKITSEAAAPTDQDAQSYYMEHKAEFQVQETAQVRQILVATESDAKALEAELKKGKRMAELAKKYSLSPEANQDGLVGWVEKGLTDIFEPAFHMKQGQRSPVLKSAFGYHIFEVMGRKPSRIKSFPESKDQIKRILMEKRQQSLYLAWLEEQVRKARVFKDQEFIDALKVETKVQ